MRIAIVDDNSEDAERINLFLKQYQEVKQVSFHISVFHSSVDFLEEYRGEYDVIFLDIEMPGSDGLSAAREIRKIDRAVGIIFVTSLAQYAIAGYEVNAIDYMVKPIRYFSFQVKLDKALSFYRQRQEKNLLIKDKNGLVRLTLSEICYIEKDRDMMVYHTKSGEYRERKSIRELKEKIEETPLEECTAGCLVNLQFIQRIGKDVVTLIDGTELPLSRRNKKAFTDRYIRYIE